jgi:RNA polymerase sigma-70 factor, ECF subfamily
VRKDATVALTTLDRDLLKRCLAHQPGAWNDFVDRFLGLVYHVIHHTAHHRSAVLKPEDVEDLAAEVLLQIVAGDYNVLRQFHGHSSLATYLTVIARRICVHELARRTAAREVQARGNDMDEIPAARPPREDELDNTEEVEKLLGRLSGRDREVVRLRHLEGRSYEEISTILNIPVNTIGPILARAKTRMRKQQTKDKAVQEAPTTTPTKEE